jgi:hypothetical protein
MQKSFLARHQDTCEVTDTQGKFFFARAIDTFAALLLSRFLNVFPSIIK